MTLSSVTARWMGGVATASHLVGCIQMPSVSGGMAQGGIAPVYRLDRFTGDVTDCFIVLASAPYTDGGLNQTDLI